MPALIPDSSDDEETSVVRSLASPSQTYYVESHYTFNEEVISIRRDREREGRCAECGVQTHTFRVDPVTRMRVKIPLNVEREVHRGRCLLCYPIVANEFLSRQAHNRGVGPGGRTDSHPRNASRYSPSDVCNAYPSQRIATRQIAAAQHELLQPYYSISDPQVREALLVLTGETVEIVDILSVMKQLPSHDIVQEKGCAMLWVQSWDDENSAAIGRVGGISIILDAMARFPENAYLQQCACETLQNLALNSYNRSEICDLGGVSLIVHAMTRHLDVASIQLCGCVALASIAASRDHHKDIMRAGGVHALICAARHFEDEEFILLGAVQALQALGHDPSMHITFPTNAQQSTIVRLLNTDISALAGVR